MPPRYRSNVPLRLAVSWQRLDEDTRRSVLQFCRLPLGAAVVQFQNFSTREVQQLVAGMRAIVSLAEECRFALGYTRMKSHATEKPSGNEENPE